jgi:hypothetical protein
MIQFKVFYEKTYYRGHAPDIDPSTPNDKGITWITPSKKLASTYGDKISKVDYDLKGRRLIIPEINVVGNILDLLKSVETLPRNTKQQKLWDAAIGHFGGGSKELLLPKFLHKIGSEKVIAFLKSMNIKVIQAKEDGIVTFGIIK